MINVNKLKDLHGDDLVDPAVVLLQDSHLLAVWKMLAVRGKLVDRWSGSGEFINFNRWGRSFVKDVAVEAESCPPTRVIIRAWKYPCTYQDLQLTKPQLNLQLTTRDV